MAKSLKEIRVNEYQAFNRNASILLLKQPGGLESFFQSIGYPFEKSGEGYRGPCPQCERFCYIGIYGNPHPIYWKCHNQSCPMREQRNELGIVRNLLGLVKALDDERNIVTAIRQIAKFLGYEGHPRMITNMNLEEDYTKMLVERKEGSS